MALLSASSGNTVTVSCAVSFLSSVIAFSSRLIDLTVFGVTVTSHEADRFVPSLVVAVIVAVPSDMAVTVPSSSTVAMLSSSLLHVMAISSEPPESIVAMS